MNQAIRTTILSGVIAASIVGGAGGATIYHNINDSKEAAMEAAKPTPTPQIIYVTPEPTITPEVTSVPIIEPTPEPTPEPTFIPSPERTPEPIVQTEYVPIYVTPDYIIYYAQAGDTLGSIAHMFKVPVYWLAGVNGIYNPDVLEVGQEIRIPKD